MNRFQLIRIANEVYGADTKWNGIQLKRLERLADLLLQIEREECAQMVMPLDESLANAIRARGNDA